MMKIKLKFICNNEEISTSNHPGLSLMDFLRKELRLTGTKEGCREGDCGACTVLIGKLQSGKVNYHSVNSCLFPLGDVNGKHIVTIEGLHNNELSVVQKSFVEEGASQCGFCTPGFIVSLTGYFLSNQNFKVEDAIYSMDGNICRCTGHPSIIQAAKKSFKELSNNISNHSDYITALIKAGLLPEYFSSIPTRLKELKSESLHEKEKSQYNISGGTDLFVQQWENILQNNVTLLSSDGLSSAIKEDSGKINIGSKATVSDLINSPVIRKYFPSLNKQLLLFGSLPIRNRATAGGNIVNASPIADMTSIFLTMDSVLKLKKGNDYREIKLRDFYNGYKSYDLDEGELIEEIIFDVPAKGSKFNFEKVSQRTYLDIASANSSIYIEEANSVIIKCDISAGGVAPVPLYLSKTSRYLTDQQINSATITEAINIMQNEISPISDARGSAEYKALLLRQLIFSHFITLFPDLISIKEIA